MFLLNSIFIHFQLFFKIKDNNVKHNDDLQSFFKFYNFYSSNENYFNKFYKQFNLGLNSNFLYLYFLYYLAKKNNLISRGDFVFFFYMTFFLNKSFTVKTFKSVSVLDFFIKSNFNKNISNSVELFNIKLNKIKNNYNNLNRSSFLNFTDKHSMTSFIKYNSTSIVKYINNNTDYSIYFLRKNKSFNKGRYSRNRQNYRTGVYWCLYVNIIALFGLYYLFYRFTFNFGYLWWLFYCLPASFIIPQAIRMRLYNPKVIYNSVTEYFYFLFNCVNIIFFNKK